MFRLISTCFLLCCSSMVFAQKELYLDSVTVHGNLHAGIMETKGLNAFEINVDNSSVMPTIFGNKDVFFVSKFLPGIATNSNLDAGIYIRGGETSNAKILLNDVEIYNPFHLFGFFSAINSDHVSKASLFQNTTDARYGGRLSGAFDIQSPHKNCDTLHASVGIGLIESHIHLESPLSKQSSIYVSARKSYLSSILSLTKADVRYDFEDFNMTIVNVPNSTDCFVWNVYWGCDKMYYFDEFSSIDFDIYWRNLVSSLTWTHRLKHFNIKQTIYSSNYKSQNTVGQHETSSEFSSAVNDLGYKLLATASFRRHLTWQAGYELVSHLYNVHNPILYNYLSEGIKDNSTINKSSSENIAFVNLSYRFNKYLSMDGSLRFDHYQSDSYGKNGVERAVSMEYKNENDRMNVTYSHHNQYVMEIPISPLSVPVNFWKSADESDSPQHSNNISLGYLHYWRNCSLQGTIFYNIFNNIKRKEINLLDLLNKGTSITDQIENGKRYCIGMELMYKYQWGQLSGWVSGTLSHAMDKFNDVNNDNWFPSPHNRIYDMNVCNIYKLNDQLDISLNLVYAKGLPYTAVKDVYLLNENILYNYGKYNERYFHAYKRADISINYTLKKKKRTTQIINCSIYNAINCSNPVTISYIGKYDTRSKRLGLYEKAKCFYRIIPSISYTIKI